jgi:RND family efflux transporter MFP subunit
MRNRGGEGTLFVVLALLFMTMSVCSAQETAPAGNAIVAESALIRVIDNVAIPARASGVLALLNVDDGDLVKKGTLLAKVDDTEEVLIHQRAVIESDLAGERARNDVAIRAAEKALEFAKQEYLRLKRASEGIPGSVSISELEESRVNSEQAELEVEKANHEHLLESHNKRLKAAEEAVALHSKDIHQILAPVNGMVVEILRRPGEWVEPGEDVLRIMRIDRLRAEGLVPFQFVTPDLTGSPAEITVAIPGRAEVTAKGQIVFVNPELNPVNGRVRVRAEFENPGGQLMPGMRAKMMVYPRPAISNPPPRSAGEGLGEGP